MKKIIVAALLLFGVSEALAQNTTGLVVASCGNQTYKVGNPGPFTVDTTGKICVSSSGGTGTVISVSVTTQNGVSAVVTNPTTTPALAFTLGAITPSSAAIGAGSAVTSSGPGGVLTSLAYTAPGTGVVTALGNAAGGAGGFALVGSTPPTGSAGGDLTGTYPNPTLVAIISAGGPTGSATVAPIITYDAKGRLTAVSSATITPAIGSITGLGTGVATALGNTAGASGGFALFNSLASYLPLAGGTLTGAEIINLNAAPAPTGISGFALQVVGADSTIGRVQANSFGAIASFTAARANGTGASPTAILSGDQIGGFNAYSYVTSASPGYVGPIASYQTYATQNHTTTTMGSKIVLATIPNGSTTLTTAFTVDQDQSIAMAGRATIATSLAIGGATIGTDALGVTGAITNSGNATLGNNSFFVSASTGVSQLYSGGILSWSSTTSANGSGDTFFRRGGVAAKFVFGNTNASVPVAQTISFQDVIAGNANNAGANATIVGSLSNGSGGSAGGAGDLILQTTASVAASGSQNTGVTGLRILSGTQEVRLPQIAADTALVDTAVCQDTTNHGLRSGSGALGVCLGTSGRQFKTAFAPMTAGIDEIMKINLWNYRYKPGHGDNGARMQYGPTAQDIEAVLPDLAGHDERGETINYDWGALIPISIRAIQQLKADNDNLYREIAELKRAR